MALVELNLKEISHDAINKFKWKIKQNLLELR